MNSYVIIINSTNGIYDYTGKAYFSPKWGGLFDARLDEGYVFLKGVKRAEPFTPLDTASIIISNMPDTLVSGTKPAREGVYQYYNGNTNKLTQSKTIQYVIARDSVTNYPIGSDLYTHELFLIEPTKIAERYICDSVSFTNKLPIDFSQITKKATCKAEVYGETSARERTSGKINIITTTHTVTPQNSSSYEALTLYTAVGMRSEVTMFSENSWTDAVDAVLNGHGTAYLDIYKADDLSAAVFTKTFEGDELSTVPTFDINLSQETEIKVGVPYRLVYTYEPSGVVALDFVSLVYETTIVAQTQKQKPWTVTDAIIRCCELVEPLKAIKSDSAIIGKEIPKFRLSGVTYDNNGNITSLSGQAAKYDKVPLPAVSLTKCTFREQLQTLGKIIHAEPRITIQGLAVSNKVYIISFDEYSERKYSDISAKKPISDTWVHSVDEYVSNLDSTADNLTNSLSEDEGAVTAPYEGGSKSLRTETMTATITDDDNSIIETLYPIQKIYKVEMKGLQNQNTYYPDFIDITAFVNEYAIYRTLSSYQGTYPNAEAYSLYYTQGKQNIYGLFFKEDGAFFPEWFNKYAINNISTMLGCPLYEGDAKANSYAQILFRVTYEPIFGQRIKQYKTKIGNNKSSLVYNQGGNLIETRYYGENLKGAVARMGNAERVLTYYLPWLTDIPNEGELFDKDHYIAAVSSECLPFFFKTTIELSKNFNRLSQFIGINSVNRLYEVSEKQAMKRDSIYCESLVLTDNEIESDTDTWLTVESLKQIAGSISYVFTFYDNDGEQTDYNYGGGTDYPPKRISCASIRTKMKDGTKIATVNLPVVSSAFGNSLAFTFKFSDNYSAGQKTSKRTAGGSTRYVADYVPYTDEYGRFYYIDFSLKNKPHSDEYNSNTAPFTLPEQSGYVEDGGYITAGDLLYRKDNIEVPSISYQVNIQTDGEYIIGSAFARECSLATGQFRGYNELGNPTNYLCQLYILNQEIGNLTDKITIPNQGQNHGLIVEPIVREQSKSIAFSIGSQTPLINGKAWAIATPPRVKTITVVDDNGNLVQQEIDEGSEILFAKNMDIKVGDTITLPRIVIKKEQN